MNYYDEIKKELINNQIIKKVKDYSKNKSDLNTYYNVGKLLSEAGKHYGDNIIKQYAKKLVIELNKSYGIRNLYNMRLFYLKISSNEILHTLCAISTWSHIKLLLSFDDNKIIYYLKIVNDQYLSVREVIIKIKNNEYERLDATTKNELISKEEVTDYIKNPILIKNNCYYTGISEKTLKKLILENIDDFLKELGKGFAYLGNEYKIKLGNRYNYIDLLLYNTYFNCYVVVELKITELKKEHIGQIQTYMNYIDKNIKKINQDKTIGVIIVKKDNKFIMEYCSDKRILSKEYILI